MSQMRFFNEMN